MRAGTWWEFKTPIFLGVACLAAAVSGISFGELWPDLLRMLFALIPLASFVCVINDITDLQDDILAGKPNSMAGSSGTYQVLWVTVCLLGGLLAAALVFWNNQTALALYIGNWIAFTLYSVPPIRLKKRGAAGVLADATGGQLLPCLWTAMLVTPHLSWAISAPLCVWAAAFGIRAILFHQAGDLEADRRSGLKTLAVHLGSARLSWFVCGLVFPLEIAALAALLWLAAPVWGAITLLVYLALQAAMWRWLRIPLRIAQPADCCRMAMLKYYQLWFPLCMILQLSLEFPAALLLIAAHALLFPGLWRRFTSHAAHIRHNIKYPPDWEKLAIQSK